ncbi:hypothetical protein [Lactobacillus rizhaonensis]|uniref:hypothetical protein n=1 Tax=Lactobacillus rizhaonensis TaxID=3082863 RepID=UPI0030C7164F
MIYIILLAVYFIACQVVVFKVDRVRKFINEYSAGKIVLYGITAIGLGTILCMALKVSWILIALITVFECSIISEKYRLVFQDMEKGRKI